MKNKILKILCFVFLSSAIFAESSSYEKLLKLAEENSSFFETDFTGNYTLVNDKPGEGSNITDAIMYRRDKEGKWTILITGPKNEKGKGYLQYDNNIWFYDPEDHCFTFTSARDKFQNTAANNSDFAPQYYCRDYKIEAAEDVTLGKLDCVCFTLVAKVENVTYPRLKVWVTKEDGYVRKKEDYSLSGQKLRTTAVPSYQIIKSNENNYAIPVKMLIVDNLRGKKINGKVLYEKTQITITNVVFQNVPDTVYTKPYLEMMSDK